MLDPIFVKPFPFNVVLFTPYKSTPSPLVQKGYATDRRWGCLAPGTVAQGEQHRWVDKNTIPSKVEKMHFQTVFKWLLRKNNFWNNSPSPAQEAGLMTPGISYGWGFSQLCRKKGQAARGWAAWYRIKEREFPGRSCQSEVLVVQVFWPVGKSHGKPQLQNTDVCQPLLDFHLVPRSSPRWTRPGYEVWVSTMSHLLYQIQLVGSSWLINVLRFLRPHLGPTGKSIVIE